MTGRNAALLLAFAGLVLAVIAGAFVWPWLRPPIVGGISGGFGVWIIVALSEGGTVCVVRWLPHIAAYGAAVGLMTTLGARIGGVQ
ncbi:hypothetical protein [Roseitranquillus sediminis]|uniref:hypothetical protein n=1 Tax=Roseitranquillus sediminis TaxID=2809051 RepID=UPI001D0C0809|nr:hypothetical protein [Roseitranquillus sediminis]MBM9596094.1 hypothetical protein [Roseitranquillus sediminis]